MECVGSGGRGGGERLPSEGHGVLGFSSSRLLVCRGILTGFHAGILPYNECWVGSVSLVKGDVGGVEWFPVWGVVECGDQGYWGGFGPDWLGSPQLVVAGGGSSAGSSGSMC